MIINRYRCSIFLLLLLLVDESKAHIDPDHGCDDGCTSLHSRLANLWNQRPKQFSITEFGGVNDGVKLNTKAFENAIAHLRSFSSLGGATLYIPKGLWLTGCFNLTSHMTLFLEHGATILASQDPKDWPVIDPLPSYGRGRELPGKRYGSLLHGHGLVDVVITVLQAITGASMAKAWSGGRDSKRRRSSTAEDIWWSSCTLLYNLTFVNPPFWTIHPVYSSNMIIKQVTILAPHKAPNTDGVDPDSSFNLCIQDCYIDNGDDAIAVKSGWDEYGLAFNRPSHHIFIQNITVRGSHGISLGSEMSGGIHNVHARDVAISEAVQAIHVKTSAGRGAYIVNSTFTNFQIFNTGVAISFTAIYGDHPDDKFNSSAFATIQDLSFAHITGSKVNRAGDFRGVAQSPFLHTCFTNISLQIESKKTGWNCSFIQGFSHQVTPPPCPELEIEQSCRSDALKNSCSSS